MPERFDKIDLKISGKSHKKKPEEAARGLQLY